MPPAEPLDTHVTREGAPHAVWLGVTLSVAILALAHWAIPYGVVTAGTISLASLIGSVATLLAWRLRRDLYQSRSWLLIGLAAAVNFAGHLIWYTQDLGGSTAWPLIANLFYLGTYGLLVAGLWLYGRHVESNQGALIDSLMIVVAAAVLFWVLMIEPRLDAAGGHLLRLVIPASYPVFDLLLLTFVLKLFFLSTVRSTCLVMLMTAVTLLLTADIIHAHGVTTGWYEPGALIDLLWFAVYALMAGAAWHPSASQTLTNGHAVAERPVLRLMFIGVVAILVPTIILVTAGSDYEIVRIGAIASIALFILMLVRMTLLLVSNQRQAVALERTSRTDPLTGAANRRWLQERLHLEIARARRTDTVLTVAYLDLDCFKEYNDTHGHGRGDELLHTIVTRWQSTLRETDLLARVGGDEFAIVLPDISDAVAMRVLQRLQATIPEDQSCSVGMTTYRDDEHIESLLGRADEALYEAKRQGSNRIAVR